MILDIIANKELKHQLSVQIKSGKKLSKDYVHGRGLNGQFFVQISDWNLSQTSIIWVKSESKQDSKSAYSQRYQFRDKSEYLSHKSLDKKEEANNP